MKTTLPLAVLFIASIGTGAWMAHAGVASTLPRSSMHLISGIHALAVAVTIALVLYADERALRWMRGKASVMSLRVVNVLHYTVAAGLAGIIVTGIPLLQAQASRYVGEPAFVVKMVAVAALIINSAFLTRFSQRATEQPFALLTKREKASFIMSGAVSFLGWLTALVGGSLLGN